MSRTQRTIVVPVISILILLAAAIGTLLGTVPPYEWDMFLARIQGRQIISIAPASNAQATLYVLDADRPATREVMVDLHVPGHGYGDSLTSMPILLTQNTGAIEMPLDDGLALRMELVPGTSYPHDWPEPLPSVSPGQVAHR